MLGGAGGGERGGDRVGHVAHIEQAPPVAHGTKRPGAAPVHPLQQLVEVGLDAGAVHQRWAEDGVCHPAAGGDDSYHLFGFALGAAVGVVGLGRVVGPVHTVAPFAVDLDRADEHKPRRAGHLGRLGEPTGHIDVRGGVGGGGDGGVFVHLVHTGGQVDHAVNTLHKGGPVGHTGQVAGEPLLQSRAVGGQVGEVAGAAHEGHHFDVIPGQPVEQCPAYKAGSTGHENPLHGCTVARSCW